MVIGIAGCAVIFILLHGSSHGIDYGETSRALYYMPPRLLALAALTTALSYGAAVVLEGCGLRYLGLKVPLAAIVVGAFCGSALDNSVGLGGLSGRTVRARVLSAVDVRPEQVDRLLLFNQVSSLVGLLVLAALGLTLGRATLGRILSVPLSALHTGGGVLLVATIAAIAWSARGRLARRDAAGATGQARAALAGLLTAFAQSAAAAGALWVLVPGAIGFFDLALLFSVAFTLGALSRIPGGLGAFELVVFSALHALVPPDRLLAGLLLYRGIYFLLPLVLAAASLAVFELRRPISRSVTTARERALVGARLLAPTFLSVITFGVGTMLIISGATPALDWRIAALQKVLPLWALEISHLLATLAGVFLLFVARGLYHRLDGAWWLAFVISLANVAFSLTKGLAFDETAALLILVFLLLATRRQFTRPAAFLRQPFTVGWFAAIAVVIAAAIGILFFAFHDLSYRREIWWQFEFDAQASRAVRAVLAASIFALALGLWQMVRPTPGRVRLPPPADLERARRIVEAQEHSAALLALMGDKSLLFSGSGNSFLMYSKLGRSWVALFDPIGPAAEWPEMVWQFVELADSHGGQAAFYQISPDTLYIYLDTGLRVMKVGEEACINLHQFDLRGSQRYGLRQAVRRAERAGVSFEIWDPGQVCGQLNTLKQISDTWLSSHHAGERRFSVASFEPRFVAAQSVILSRHLSRPLAFVSFMTTRSRTEATVALMRAMPQAPPYLMEFMLTQLALFLREEGFSKLSLGMAPLAGLVRTPLSSKSHVLAGLLWKHGSAIYNFQGLRAFKNKFRPVWEPRYVAASGSFGPFLTLADVAALASGYLGGHAR
jgi:phosphatidylglycerol lysyltransferase